MVSISGIRGVVGKSLFPAVIEKYIAAFVQFKQAKRLVIGHDSRLSGPWVENIAVGVLIAMGCEVVRIGLATTPTVQLMVSEYQTDGGIVITASHNPIEWNGLKFIDYNTMFLSPEKCNRMFALADTGDFSYSQWDGLGRVLCFDNSDTLHLKRIFDTGLISKEKIRERKFRVALDCVNGAGGPIMCRLLEELGCEVFPINCEPNGHFAHSPEPIPENLTDLCKIVKEKKTDLGIAVDPDVDRCVLINEKGEPIGEEYTFVMAVALLLGHYGKRGAIVRNLSSSRATDDIASKYEGCPVYAVPVGEINVGIKMEEVNAIIGGEGNGGVMLPDVHIGRDALVATTLTLQHLLLIKGTLSELKDSLPQWEIVKLKVPLKNGLDPLFICNLLHKEWSNRALTDESINIEMSDGIRINTNDWWVHIRGSNTESIIRVIGEAATLEVATQICTKFINYITSITNN